MITVDDPEGVDMHDPDLAVEMIVESTRVIDQVTELAEKWQELALKPFEVDERTTQWVVQVTKTKTELRLMMSMFMAAESIRKGEKDPLQWILEEVMASKMEEAWKETMTPKNLGLVEVERAPKPEPRPARAAWEEYNEAEMEAAVAKRRLLEVAQRKGEEAEMPRREQGALLREVRLRQAEKQVKAPVPAPQPVQEEDDEMDQDEEEPEAEEEGEGTSNALIEVVAETALPRELPKPVEERRKPMVEEATTEAMPKRAAAAAAMGQWAGGPPKDKRRVVVDEIAVGPSRLEKREDKKGEDEKSIIQWLGAPTQRVKSGSSQQRRRSEVCLYLKIWRNRQWRLLCGRPLERRH